MDRKNALDLIDQYCETMLARGHGDEVVTHLRDRFPEDGSERKAMRWLGFMQGVLYSQGVYSLEQLKEHSRNLVIE